MSSVLTPQFGNTYGPRNLFDRNLLTAWVEGVDGHGIGEWIIVDFSGRRSVDAIEIMNGYHKNEDIFRKNSRVRTAEIIFSNGRRRAITLADRAGTQIFSMDAKIIANWVQFKISSVYPGWKYQDTAITEFSVRTSNP